ncbi:MAG: ABC transporter substrate-binding protein [Spirochaetia bacterium]|jgi:iron complex transport system substrate-binding protein|nr:ABC transporter substrate-binding protein [Spirochaetia bacterium]
MKKLFSITILLFTTTLLFAAGQSEIQSPSIVRGITIVDSFERSVTIEQPAMRVVSTAPSVTETIFALGMGNLLVGRTDYCDYPEEALSIASIGSLMEPDIEAIAELSPDVVIASTHFTKESLNKLTALSIPVVILADQDSFEGAYKTIEDISRIIGAEIEGNKLTTDMKNTVNKVKKAVSGKEKPSVYYVIGFGEYGDFTAGGDTFINQIIEMAGGNNIASGIKGWSFSLEQIVDSDPDILVCSKFWGVKSSIKSTNGYNDLKAVRNGDLFEIDNNMLDRQGPRLAEGLKALAEIIHPNAF